jgi:hypothetical protein
MMLVVDSLGRRSFHCHEDARPRGHSLTIDHGRQAVAQEPLDFVERFLPAKPN